MALTGYRGFDAPVHACAPLFLMPAFEQHVKLSLIFRFRHFAKLQFLESVDLFDRQTCRRFYMQYGGCP